MHLFNFHIKILTQMKKSSDIVFAGVVSFLIISFFVSIQAAPGDLDSAFGIKGSVTTALGKNSSDIALAVVVQPDGKIIAAGKRDTNVPTYDAIVIRYNPDGTLDPSFDFDGIVSPLASSYEEANSVALQSDGKIVVSGYAYNNTLTAIDFFVLRLNSNGSLDETFGNGGRVFTDFNSVNDWAAALIIQPDGKILVGGGVGVGSYLDFGLVRYNLDGSLDSSFGNGGKTVIRGTSYDDRINSITLQPDGKIVAAGSTFTGINNHFAVLRCNSDGSVDTTFDGDGILTTSMGVADYVTAVILQPDGKILAVGSAYNGSYDMFAVVRYNANGSLDTSFDGDGKLTTTIITSRVGTGDAVLQPDGKLLVVGFSLNKVALLRYNTDGSLDTEFNNTGIVTTAIGTIEDKAVAVALLANGKIVVAGSSFDGTSGSDFAVVRYESNGALDNTFGPPGRVLTSFRNDYDSATGIAIQPDGKIIAVGSSRNGIYKDFAVARYNPNGDPDTTFGNRGKVITSVNTQDDEATEAAIQPDGKIVVLGFSGKSQIALVRYNSNGSPDTTFDTDGKLTLSIAMGAAGAGDLVIQPDGKIVVAGSAGVNSSVDFALVRFNPDGSLDTTFDFDGVVTTPVTERGDYANAIALQPDGKLLVAGTVEATAFYRTFGIVRYMSDGSLDTSFGNGGKVLTRIGDGNAEANAVALQTDGRIVVAGYTAANSDFATVRYNEDGTLDTMFGGDGIVTTTVTETSGDNAYDVLIQKNGKIVIAGLTVFPGSEFNIALARYNTDGSLDKSFNDDGIVVTDYGSFGEAVYAAALQADGKIVVAGGIDEVARRDFAVLRYLGDEVSTPPTKSRKRFRFF
jgi:uncharacterized delta-60 repeat protein